MVLKPKSTTKSLTTGHKAGSQLSENTPPVQPDYEAWTDLECEIHSKGLVESLVGALTHAARRADSAHVLSTTAVTLVGVFGLTREQALTYPQVLLMASTQTLVVVTLCVCLRLKR